MNSQLLVGSAQLPGCVGDVRDCVDTPAHRWAARGHVAHVFYGYLTGINHALSRLYNIVFAVGAIVYMFVRALVCVCVYVYLLN